MYRMASTAMYRMAYTAMYRMAYTAMYRMAYTAMYRMGWHIQLCIGWHIQLCIGICMSSSYPPQHNTTLVPNILTVQYNRIEYDKTIAPFEVTLTSPYLSVH